MSRRRWTPEEDAALREMTAAGRTAPEVSAALQRPFHSVQARKQLIGVRMAAEHLQSVRVANGRRRRGEKRPAETPEVRAKKSEIMRARWAAMTPEERAGRLHGVLESVRSEEGRRRRGRSVRETRLAWCPEPFREEYLALIRRKKVPAIEARAMMQPRIDAWLRTFEGQLWKVKTGRARVVPTVHLSRPIATPFSLTGGSL